MAEVELEAGQTEETERCIEKATEELEPVDAHDLQLRLDLMRSRVMLSKGRRAEAFEMLEGNAARALSSGLDSLCAEIAWHLAYLFDQEGAEATSKRYRSQARQLWEQGLLGLATAQRQAFWSHPRRRGAITPTPEGRSEDRSNRESKLALLQEINKRINSTVDTKQILRSALDGAIELTGAERGFVLLSQMGPRPDGGAILEVAVARNLDQEEVDRSEMKFSRSIAEQVFTTASPLLTADAERDQRWATGASIHSMSLKSVLSVPIQSPEGVLGALYLDNRFQRGRFTPEDVPLLAGFADQVAIALTNARLHAQLVTRNRELERERRRVEELLQGQAEEIDRLSQEVTRHRAPRAHRFDYSGIVGSSKKLDDVLSVLDRVIDAPLP
ncbi:GAF domain-containing protein, partial [bacterium]|nr:GAF domain-containing protein [bacterium]